MKSIYLHRICLFIWDAMMHQKWHLSAFPALLLHLNSVLFLLCNETISALSAHNTSLFPFWIFLALGPDSTRALVCTQRVKTMDFNMVGFNPLKPELNPICYLLALLRAHHFLHVSRIRVKLLTFRLIMSYTYGAPILDVSRSHTTTQHSR